MYSDIASAKSIAKSFSDIRFRQRCTHLHHHAHTALLKGGRINLNVLNNRNIAVQQSIQSPGIWLLMNYGNLEVSHEHLSVLSLKKVLENSTQGKYTDIAAAKSIDKIFFISRFRNVCVCALCTHTHTPFIPPQPLNH